MPTFSCPIYNIIKFFYHNSLKKKVGKWANSPQTRINTGFLLAKVPGQFSKKVGKVGKKCLKIEKIVRKSSPKIFKISRIFSSAHFFWPKAHFSKQDLTRIF